MPSERPSEPTPPAAGHVVLSEEPTDCAHGRVNAPSPRRASSDPRRRRRSDSTPDVVPKINATASSFRAFVRPPRALPKRLKIVTDSEDGWASAMLGW